MGKKGGWGAAAAAEMGMAWHVIVASPIPAAYRSAMLLMMLLLITTYYYIPMGFLYFI